jgi:hypothetical protein
LGTLRALDERSPQCALNGRFCTKNLWIVKPSAKSRGRGIRTFRDVDKVSVGPPFCDVGHSTQGGGGVV